ncbi:MAG: DUF5711 family protein [Oscillospiraceae bacterium]|jgi:hypothetical protein|nr:DUF5711 family protein [Oscillospiraceae bacterium]
MTGAGKTQKRRAGGRRIRRLAGSAAILAFVAALTYSLAVGGGRPDLSGVKRALAGLRGVERADEFICAPGYDAAFADLDGGFVTAGALGFKVFGADGQQLAHESFKMSEPMTSSSGGHAVVYDAGGTSVRLIDSAGGLAPIVEPELEIISAAINGNGWLALCTREGGGYKGSVTVYGADGDMKYKWYSAQGYIMSAALSRDNRELAVLSLGDTGGRITLLKLQSEQVQGTFDLAGGVILEIKYTPDGRLLAVAENSLISVDGAGTGAVVRDFSGKYLGGWAIGDDGLTALLLLDYGVGDAGTLETYDARGAALGAVSTDSRCISLSVNGGVAVLWRDRLSLYDASLRLESEFHDVADVVSALARADGAALAVGRGVAKVYDSA